MRWVNALDTLETSVPVIAKKLGEYMQEVLLKDIRHQSFPDEPITTWKFVGDDYFEGAWRIYFKPVEHSDLCNGQNCGHGFYFYSTAWGGHYTHNKHWSDETFADTLYHGVALFDGLRHVYLGSEQDGIAGYTYYPDPEVHIAIWKALLALEAHYCGNVER